MGNVNFGAPKEIIQELCASFKVQTFVETGTYMGNTAAWASERFTKVITIEGSPEFRRQAQERHANKTNIEFLLGDSRLKLQEVVDRLGEEPALFWLDAHWMPGSFGETHECPLLDEIAILQKSRAKHYILIDDARLFLAPPPLPHRAVDWPDISAVMVALNANGATQNYNVVYEDVIFSIPSSGRETMEGYFQRRVTTDLNHESASTWLVRKVRGKFYSIIRGSAKS